MWTSQDQRIFLFPVSTKKRGPVYGTNRAYSPSCIPVTSINGPKYSQKSLAPKLGRVWDVLMLGEKTAPKSVLVSDIFDRYCMDISSRRKDRQRRNKCQQVYKFGTNFESLKWTGVEPWRLCRSGGLNCKDNGDCNRNWYDSQYIVWSPRSSEGCYTKGTHFTWFEFFCQSHFSLWEFSWSCRWTTWAGEWRKVFAKTSKIFVRVFLCFSAWGFIYIIKSSCMGCLVVGI